MEQSSPPGDRIAKVLARAGVASRREAERMIEAGRVSVNGKVIDSPALNVTAKDRVTVDGQPLAAPEPARLWLYNKPAGLVTTAKDEQGRETVFDALPEDMPRVMSVGRLDLNSEGLLLLTNDGELKRRLELPSTGWLRRYRVRVNGKPDDAMLEPLRKGIEIEGEKFQAMEVVLDRQQGANAWLTVGLREGKNREIRRAMEAVGLTVNRLIRVSYGPFQLGKLAAGEVSEIKGRVLRDQLGLEPVEAPAPGRKPAGRPGGRPGGKTAGKPGGKPDAAAGGRSRPGAGGPGKPGRPRGPRDEASDWQSGKRPARDDKPAGRSGGKPAGKSAGSFGGRTGATTGGKPGGKPGQGSRPSGSRTDGGRSGGGQSRGGSPSGRKPPKPRG